MMESDGRFCEGGWLVTQPISELPLFKLWVLVQMTPNSLPHLGLHTSTVGTNTAPAPQCRDAETSQGL